MFIVVRELDFVVFITLLYTLCCILSCIVDVVTKHIEFKE